MHSDAVRVVSNDVGAQDITSNTALAAVPQHDEMTDDANQSLTEDQISEVVASPELPLTSGVAEGQFSYIYM